MSIALGSHGELETLVDIAARLRYLTTAQRNALIEQMDLIGRMLNRLHQSLDAKVEGARNP